MAKVTIIVSVYGVADYLQHYIQSMKSQTFRDFLVYFVNDGTKDNSCEVIEKCVGSDDRFKYIHVDANGVSSIYDRPQNCSEAVNYGLNAARNAGMQYISSEYFAFADPDDWIDEKYLERLVFEADRTHADMTKAEICRDYEDGKVVRVSRNNKIRALINRQLPVYIHCCGSQWITCLYRTELAKKIQLRLKTRADGFEFDADDLFILEYSTLAKSYAFCDDVYYHYYQRATSAVHVINEKRFTSTICCRKIKLQLINKFLDENKYSEKGYALIALCVLWELAKHYRIYIKADRFNKNEYLEGCAEILKQVRWNAYINQSSLSFFKPLLSGNLEKAGLCMTSPLMIGIDKLRLIPYGL